MVYLKTLIKERLYKFCSVLLNILLIISICYFLVINCVFYIFYQATTEITNIKKYEEIVHEYKNNNFELLKYFPDKIDVYKNKYKFSYIPQFLQWGGHIQLRIFSNKQDIEDLYSSIYKNKLVSYFWWDSNEHINLKDGIPTTNFYTNTSNSKFSKDYEIVILFAKPYKKNDWNHWDTSWVILNKDKMEVIYWAEFW